MKYNYQINTPTPEHFKKLIKCLYALGYKFENYTSYDEFSKNHPHTYEWIVINVFEKASSANDHEWSPSKTKTITFDEFLALGELPTYPLIHGDVYVDPILNCNSFLLVEVIYKAVYKIDEKRFQLVGLHGTSVNSGKFFNELHTREEIRDYLIVDKMVFSKNVSQEIYNLVSSAKIPV